jgi:hypothetical protein
MPYLYRLLKINMDWNGETIGKNKMPPVHHYCTGGGVLSGIVMKENPKETIRPYPMGLDFQEDLTPFRNPLKSRGDSKTIFMGKPQCFKNPTKSLVYVDTKGRGPGRGGSRGLVHPPS